MSTFVCKISVVLSKPSSEASSLVMMSTGEAVVNSSALDARTRDDDFLNFSSVGGLILLLLT